MALCLSTQDKPLAYAANWINSPAYFPAPPFLSPTLANKAIEINFLTSPKTKNIEFMSVKYRQVF